MLDIFNADAFSLVRMTEAINNIDNVPGRAGELAFNGVSEGVSTLAVAIESLDYTLSLIPVTARHGPAPQEVTERRRVTAVTIPQVKLEDTIPVGLIQGVRTFGSDDQTDGVQVVVNQQMKKMTLRHDLTLEHMRMGALQGRIMDSDGVTVLLDLYEAFGVDPPAEIDMSDVLLGSTEEETSVRLFSHNIARLMKRSLKGVWPGSARIHAFAGDNFFDRLVEAKDIKGVYSGWDAAERRLGENYAFGTYYYAGIFWENYHGTDDNSTVAVDPDDAILFPVGVPGLYAEYFAPADFLETANTIGLPRYAKIANDGKFNRSLFLHTQQNPLPICTRPRVLLRATINPGT